MLLLASPSTPHRRRARFAASLRLDFRVVALAILVGLGGPVGPFGPRVAEAAIVERVVAVVGQYAILLSDLKERSLPYLLRVYATVPEGPQRAGNISQIYDFVLNQMIDERLEEDAARYALVEIS